MASSLRALKRRTVHGTLTTVLAVLCAFLLSGCITIPTSKKPQPTASATGPLSYLEKLQATPVNKATDAPTGDKPQFVTDTRNIACVFTTSRNGNLDQPWEPNNYADQANATSPIIPVVNCELARYPEPAPADVTDNCSGTFIGYLGGTVLLLPDKVSYGGCRAGVTAVEASFGTSGTVDQNMSQIPVLKSGNAMESQGYRCAPMDDGVACANLSSGLGFFVSEKKYELFGPGHNAPASTTATDAASTQATS